ncbi:MAG: Gfo/Idh/MocA family oxidoreductase [Planctomycetota bacterium]
MKNDEIGIGIVGLGIGRSRAKLVKQTDGARLVAVCDLDEGRGRKAEKEFQTEWIRDYDEMLARNDIDVVMVMTPSGMHAKMGIHAAQAGKHVVTTKPIDVKLDAIDALIAACDQAGVRLVTDFNFRYLANNVRIRRAIEEGRFGKMIFGEARLKWYRSQDYYSEGAGWRGTWAMDGGGALMNQTVHQIDLLQWFMGDVESVAGQTGIFTHKIETEDIGMALLTFKNGAFGMILGTTTYPFGSIEPTIEIHGDAGAVVSARGELETWQFADKEFEKQEFTYDGPTNIAEDVVGMLRDGKNPMVTGPEARKAVEIILAIYESAKRGGEKITLPL